MMFTTNNLSPSVIGSIPLSLNKIKEFKYYDGSFYIINSSTDKLYKFTNGNFTEVTLNGNDVLNNFNNNARTILYFRKLLDC